MLTHSVEGEYSENVVPNSEETQRDRGSECNSSWDAHILLNTKRKIPNKTFSCEWMSVSAWLCAYAWGTWASLTVKLRVTWSGGQFWVTWLLMRTWWVQEGMRQVPISVVLITSGTLGRWESDISPQTVWRHWRQWVHVYLQKKWKSTLQE